MDWMDNPASYELINQTLYTLIKLCSASVFIITCIAFVSYIIQSVIKSIIKSTILFQSHNEMTEKRIDAFSILMYGSIGILATKCIFDKIPSLKEIVLGDEYVRKEISKEDIQKEVNFMNKAVDKIMINIEMEKCLANIIPKKEDVANVKNTLSIDEIRRDYIEERKSMNEMLKKYASTIDDFRKEMIERGKTTGEKGLFAFELSNVTHENDNEKDKDVNPNIDNRYNPCYMCQRPLMYSVYSNDVYCQCNTKPRYYCGHSCKKADNTILHNNECKYHKMAVT